MKTVTCDRCTMQAAERKTSGWGQVTVPLHGTHDLCPECSVALLRWVKGKAVMG